jgi:hypothetical protein
MEQAKHPAAPTRARGPASVQTFYRPIDIFREQSTRAATHLLQRKKLCQSTIFFANGAAIACLPLQLDVRTTH